MKKILLSIFSFAVAASGINSFAQQVTNGGFESWGPASPYTANAPNGWGTTNLDAAFGPTSTTQGVTGAYEGSSYAVISTETGYSSFGAPSDTLSGVVLHGGDLFGGGVKVPYAYRPLSVTFAYQSNLVALDTGGVYMELTKWNGSSADLVGAIWFPITGTNASWNVVNVPVYYFTSDVPDSMFFMGLSSAGSFQLANVFPEPGSEISLDAVTICQQLDPSFTYNATTFTVDFTETTTATGAQLSWDFGDGNNSTQSNPSHTYASASTYTVSLTVTDSCGNDSTVTQNVTVIDDSGIESGIANSTFSVFPNPSNDVFNVNLEMAEAREINIELYDLSGRKIMNVFNGNVSTYQTEIDGTDLERGTYILRISSAEGFIQKKITLIK